MLIDNLTRVDNAHAYSANAVSTSSYDTAAAGNDISIGQPMCFVVTVGAAAKVSGGTETYEFDIIQSANAALTAPDVLAAFTFTNAQAVALLTLGAAIQLPIPMGSITKRFLGLQFVGANTPTITITSWITPQSMQDRTHIYGTRIVVL